jgi:hypothetical protein
LASNNNNNINNKIRKPPTHAQHCKD